MGYACVGWLGFFSFLFLFLLLLLLLLLLDLHAFQLDFFDIPVITVRRWLVPKRLFMVLVPPTGWELYLPLRLPIYPFPSPILHSYIANNEVASRLPTD
ncbi:hypothetical protein K504DRAFT_6190 [Pleomassaria siparia CBS 279.74]|uniref:Uncharacterized protein n=1 Tax=Pleomassaria siparia CBS 279.74 TaxID=1314801 RepID=A0A6G1KQ07_9PLEO|nr:hypothetical protein K504DRAFT_6190 [Pleomassaria siparia CBS 279.74]